MSARTRRVTTATIGMATAAGAVSAAGAVARRSRRRRSELDGLDASLLGTDHPLDWEPTAQQSVATDDGVSLHVEIDEPAEWTSGATIVFTHGYCLSSASWVHQRRAAVRAGYRCVAWDQRGHGRSAWGGVKEATIEQLGNDLAAVIAASAAGEDLALVGHSMGGMTMMALADSHPDLVRDRVKAAAFLATSAGGGGMISLGFGRFLGAAVLRMGPGMLTNLAARQRVWKTARRIGRDLESALVEHFSFASPVSEETVRYSADILLGTDLSVVGAFLPALEAHDKRVALAAYRHMPVLVLNGEDDLLTPPEHSLAIVEALPESEHVVVTDAGHLIMLEYPALVDAQLLALIDRVSTPHTGSTGVPTQVTDIARQVRVARRRARSGSRRRAEEAV